MRRYMILAPDEIMQATTESQSAEMPQDIGKFLADVSISVLVPSVPEGRSDRRAELAWQLMTYSFQISEMLHACRLSDKIDGPDGVAARLKITRKAVYVRFKNLGLEADDFRSPNATVAGLLFESPFARRIISLFQKEKGRNV